MQISTSVNSAQLIDIKNTSFHIFTYNLILYQQSRR